MGETDEPLLAVRNLEKHYPVTEGVFARQTGTVRAVDGVSFTIESGETLGLVGESGCGKSTVATSLLRLEEPTGGSVHFDGRDVTAFDDAELKRFRREAQPIFQDPDASFDPRMSVGESVTEPLLIHGVADPDRRRAVGEDLLERVGLDGADFDRYPHEFSGGQRQRMALARALVVRPRLLVADEPVSALDVSVQSEILALLADLRAEFGLATLLISHDLSVVREVCDRVAVMYLGEIVEIGPTERIFADPHHPYTAALLSSIPEPSPGERRQRAPLRGNVPDAADPPPGCRFHTRCPAVIQPEGLEIDQGTWRRLLDAMERLREGDVDVEAIRRRVAAEVDASPDRELESAIRAELELAEPVPDDAIERALSAAVDALVEGDVAGAAERLGEVVATPCAEHVPKRRFVDDRREVACHLHGPEDGVVAPDDGGKVEDAGFQWADGG